MLRNWATQGKGFQLIQNTFYCLIFSIIRLNLKNQDDQIFSNILSIFDVVADPENKATTIITSSVLNLINNQYLRGISSLFLMKENINMMCVGFAFKPFSPFYEIINRKVARLFESVTFTTQRFDVRLNKKT